MLAKSEAVLIDVVHDLRQPLSTIETSAFILQSLLPDAPARIREHLDLIERQVALASRILHEAGTGVIRARVHRAERENLEFTKSATAVVT
jgi:signal transduction histidine kinase